MLFLFLFLIVKVFADLRFSPIDGLDFDSYPILILGQKSFTITNFYDKEVQIISVSSDSINFHAVMFQPSLLQPQEEVHIEMLFLPYYAETVQSSLNISTSEGIIKYPITGRAIPNPYKLHPFLGQILQYGTTPYEQPILIYNPYKEPLHIREVFTTADFLSLKGAPLLTDDKEVQTGSKMSIKSDNNTVTSITNTQNNMWVVESGFDKEIIILSISAIDTGSFTGYVHIKTSKDNMVLPVEVQVLSGITHTLKSRQEKISFGILTRIGQKATQDLWLENFGDTDISIVEIAVEKEDINLMITPIAQTVYAQRKMEYLIAQLTYIVGQGSYDNIKSDKIVNVISVFTNNSNPALAVLDISYEVNILLGTITLEGNDVHLSNSLSKAQQQFILPLIEAECLMKTVTNPIGKTYSKSNIDFEDNENENADNGIHIKTNDAEDGAKNGDQIANEASKSSESSLICEDIDNYVERDFILTNKFAIPIRLLSLSISSCQDIFSVVSPFMSFNNWNFSDNNNNHTSDIAISQQQWPPIQIIFNQRLAYSRLKSFIDSGGSQFSFLPYTCWLELTSDRSTHRFPLYVIDGLIQISYVDVVSALGEKEFIGLFIHQSLSF
jgi:hypothetical protein